MKRIVIYILYFSLVVAQPGILNVGFDVDDTILFSRDVFLSLPDDKRDPVDYSWINSHDKDFSVFITQGRRTGPRETSTPSSARSCDQQLA